MDIRVLKYFLEIAKEGNITKAAENLHITQPTLSRQMMNLEKELGCDLFVRGNRQIMLTDSGFLFQQRAREIVGIWDKTIREVSEQNDLIGGTISIACVETIASRFLSDSLLEFKKLHPMVKYEIYSADTNDIKEKIDRGDADLGILLEPVEKAKYDYINLPYYEEWGVVMRDDDPLAKKESITTYDIQDLPLIFPRRQIVIEEIAKWFEIDRDRLNIVASHNLLTNSLILVNEGFGYTVCVKGAFDIRQTNGLCFIPFEPKRSTGHVLAWKKNKPFTSATTRFLQYIKDKY